MFGKIEVRVKGENECVLRWIKIVCEVSNVWVFRENEENV